MWLAALAKARPSNAHVYLAEKAIRHLGDARHLERADRMLKQQRKDKNQLDALPAPEIEEVAQLVKTTIPAI